jgi:small subunit ribosomal protein S18
MYRVKTSFAVERLEIAMADETVKAEGATTEAPERPQSSGAPQRREGGGPRGDRGPRPAGSGRDGGRKFFRRKKVCKFCVEKIDAIDYKDVRLLGQFVAESGKIVPRRLTGVCTPHQRRLSDAIKQARNIALLPFASAR